MFYHLLTQEQFENHYDGPEYGSEILKENAFLHCCTGNQLPKVLEKHYSGERRIIALEINENALKADCRYESGKDRAELFPHIYDVINKEAISRIFTVTHDLLMIGEAQPQDLHHIIALYSQLNPGDDYNDRERIKKAWEAILSDGKITCLLAFKGDVPAATCTVTIIPNLSRNQRSYAVIENVVTREDFKRKGFGKAIMEKAVDMARSANCYKVMLLSSSSRKEAHSFYESLGFDGDAKKGFQIRFD